MEKVIFGEQINKYLAGEMDRYSDIKVCDTPAILVMMGLKQLPMLYTQKHLEDALLPKTFSHKGGIHAHGLDIQDLIKIPGELSDPVMVFDSEKNGSIVVVTSIKDKDEAPIIVVIKPDGKGNYECQRIDSNFITSIYGKDNGFENMIQRAIDGERILFCNKIKSEKLFGVPLLQSLRGLNNFSFNTIIHQSRNISRNSSENSVEIMEDKI